MATKLHRQVRQWLVAWPEGEVRSRDFNWRCCGVTRGQLKHAISEGYVVSEPDPSHRWSVQYRRTALLPAYREVVAPNPATWKPGKRQDAFLLWLAKKELKGHRVYWHRHSGVEGFEIPNTVVQRLITRGVVFESGSDASVVVAGNLRPHYLKRAADPVLRDMATKELRIGARRAYSRVEECIRRVTELFENGAVDELYPAAAMVPLEVDDYVRLTREKERVWKEHVVTPEAIMTLLVSKELSK